MSEFTLSEAEAALLAQSTHRCLAAEKLMLKAKADAFKYLCLGSVLAVAGATLGGGLWASSQILDKTAHVDQIADAMGKALAAAKLDVHANGPIPVEGSVALADNQQVRLKEGQTVALTQKEPLKVTGSVHVDVGSPEAPTSGAQNQMVENFTVFKSAPFAEGVVVTGWSFRNSSQTFPSSQYCYYAKPGVSVDAEENVRLGNDGVQLPPIGAGSFDENMAFQKCIWFQS
jgi:hypothetical protein